jgi:hypothetical protein
VIQAQGHTGSKKNSTSAMTRLPGRFARRFGAAGPTLTAGSAGCGAET